jgi:hypothetical protein
MCFGYTRILPILRWLIFSKIYFTTRCPGTVQENEGFDLEDHLGLGTVYYLSVRDAEGGLSPAFLSQRGSRVEGWH